MGRGGKTVHMEIDLSSMAHLPSPTTKFGGKDDMVGVLVHTLYIKAIVYQSCTTRLLLLNRGEKKLHWLTLFSPWKN